ncbi:hypothetical protein LTR27_002543 [Elasticomyces elasticus]|nr:hypothetical protein LTR27_002543 [Elasticomyces elasticus]
MSLFGLFSKPRVEKARGYAEQGLAAPSTLDLRHANASKLTFADRSEHGDGVSELQTRAASAMSFRHQMTRPGSRANTKPSAHATPSRKGSAFEAPPLFQAYPQSIKHGVLQVSTMTAETVLQKSKSRRAGGLAVEAPLPRGSTDDRGSIDTRRSAKTTFRHVANGSIGHVELPKKILVLVTSGYLLQYAESGPSNRLPERVLQLGQESAAFACDLIPGKHYVLQISQAVDQQGVLIANSSSIFSRWGSRSAAAKRMTANLLLVMPDVAEMDSWMTAIREEIAMLGSATVRPELTVRPDTRGSIDMREESVKSPSRSHHYHIGRTPSKVSLMSTSNDMESHNLPLPPRIRDDDERSETGTIDGIEEEAAQLAEPRTSLSRFQREADVQSKHSSVATSMDQQRLNSLRSSQRISHSTVATTIGSSRTNSLCSSPPSEDVMNGGSESSTESNELKPHYRALSSYAGAVTRRRSAMPLPSQKEQSTPMLSLPTSTHLHQPADTDNDSPIFGRNSPMMTSASPRKLTVATSEPNLRAIADSKAKHDSHMPTPPLLPPLLSDEAERPLSIVGDLPSSLSLASERSPNKRISSLMRRKQSPQSFSLPLKINPSTPDNRPPTRQENRGSFNRVEASSGEPLVHTLTAKIENSPKAPSSTTASPQSGAAKNVVRTPSGRLSLFPSQLSTPPLLSPAMSEHQQLPAGPPMAHALKRPTSMQVRSDPAPFLRGVRIRTSAYGQPQAQSRSFTAPIRSLKPSRSANHMPTKGDEHTAPSPTDPFSMSSSTFQISEEESDKPTPLPERALSPSPLRPPSRNTSGRKLKTHASLPELDLGIPVVGLGPPAPPPSAPLPLPPPASRPTSPLPAVTGLGIRV